MILYKMATIKIKRIYEPFEKEDGRRVLVDQLWPRGVRKETAHLDEWMKAVAPSADLRKWFDHDPAKWNEFYSRYTIELKQNDAVRDLLDMAKKGGVLTLLYGARDEQHNQALVLQQFISDALKS